MDSLRGEVWARKTRLTLPLFIELPVPGQESAQSCICVLRVSIFPVSRILIFDLGIVPTVWYFRIVPTVWYFFVFHFITTTTTTTTTTMYTNLLLDTTLYDKEVS